MIINVLGTKVLIKKVNVISVSLPISCITFPTQPCGFNFQLQVPTTVSHSGSKWRDRGIDWLYSV